MTRRESAILSAFTGVLCGPFDAMQEYVEELLGRPVFTHEMGRKDMADEIRSRSKADFVALAESVER